MPYHAALTSGQLDSLRGTTSVAPKFRAATYISFCPNTNIYTAQINQSSFNAPLAELTYDNGSGTLGDVQVGMTVLVSRTNDRTKAFYRGRIRKTPTSDTLYISETGSAFADNDYIFILDDHDIHEKLPRDVNGETVPDWDVPWRALLPLITDLQSVYVDWVDTGTGTYEISFAPTVTATADGATISTYAWDVQDGTITSGTAASKDITATFPYGHRIIYFTATDSNGNDLTRAINIWAHDPDDYPPQLLSFANLSIQGDIDSGFNATFDAFDEVDTVLDETLCVVWHQEWYNDTETHIVNNIAMIGRLLRDDSPAGFRDDGQKDSRTTFEIEGVLSRLARRIMPSIEILSASSPDAFNEVKDLTVWRAIWLLMTEYSTLASLHSVTFFSTTEDYLYAGLTSNGTNLLEAINDFAQSINAVMQTHPDGTCEIVRRSSYLDSTDRSALTTVVDFTTSDLLDIEPLHAHGDQIGLVVGDGGGYNSTSGETSAYDARAPRGAPKSVDGTGYLRQQILIANQSETAETAELKERIGHALAAQQDVDTLIVDFVDGYHWLSPAVDERYTFTLDGSETVRGLVLDNTTYWWLQSIDITPGVNPQTGEPSGTIAVRATFVEETTGEDGEIIYHPTVEFGAYPLGLGEFTIPPINLPQSFPRTIDLDFTDWDAGGTGPYGTHTNGTGWVADCDGSTRELLDLYFNIGSAQTLTSITITYDATYAGGADGQNLVQVGIDGGGLTTVGSFTTQTGTGITQTFTFSGITGNVIRIFQYAGGSDCSGALTVTDLSYTIADTTAEWSHTFDFLVENDGWTVYPGRSASYSAGTGWTAGDWGTYARSVDIERAISGGATITGISMTFTATLGTITPSPPATNGSNNQLNLLDSGGSELVNFVTYCKNSTTEEWQGTQAAVYKLQAAARCSNNNPQDGSLVLTSITVTGLGENPFV